MPPIVARNSSGSESSEHSNIRPSATRSHDAADVLAETTIDVMVLAVYVGGHHAAQGDKLRAGRDGHEPAAGQEDAVQFRQATRRPRPARAPLCGSNFSRRSASVVSATGKSPRAGSDESP